MEGGGEVSRCAVGGGVDSKAVLLYGGRGGGG